MKKYNNDSLNDIVQVSVVDKAERDYDIKKIMGSLSIEEFAKTCECAPGEIYKIFEDSKPMSKNLIMKMATHTQIPKISDTYDYDIEDVAFSILKYDNGMAFKEDMTDRKLTEYEKETHNQELFYKHITDVKIMKNAVYDSMNSRNYSGHKIQYDKYPPSLKLISNISNVSVFKLKQRCPQYHCYTFFVPGGRYLTHYPYYHQSYSQIEDSEEPQEFSMNVTQEVQEFFTKDAAYILYDISHPELFQDVAKSYVFDEEEYYNAFYKLLSRFKVNNNISVVLVKDGAVKEERFIVRTDGIKPISILN